MKIKRYNRGMCDEDLFKTLKLIQKYLNEKNLDLDEKDTQITRAKLIKTKLLKTKLLNNRKSKKL